MKKSEARISPELRRNAGSTLFIGALVVVSLSVFTFSAYNEMSAACIDTYQYLSFFIAPSSDKARTYGDAHFDARISARYNREKAEWYYLSSLHLNPKEPFVEHQLARLAFLRGDLYLALSRISREIETNPEPSPSSYYVRGLIEGYLADYPASERDYRMYLKSDPYNWAAVNDLAWVLLKDNRPQDALTAIDGVLGHWHDNPWLLNSRAIALYDLHRTSLARTSIVRAAQAVMHLTPQEWSTAYPGNDPLIAVSGVAALQDAIRSNAHMIALTHE